MRLDRYIGEQPKFKVLRRQDDGTYKEVPAFDYFVLKLSDKFTPAALNTYANEAFVLGDRELAQDVARLAGEAHRHPQRKQPD